MFVLTKSWRRLKIVYVRSKTRSLGQILEKPYVCSRGHIFGPIIMKLGWNICPDESRTNTKMGHAGSKIRSLGQVSEKPCVHFRGHIFSQKILKLGQNVCLDKISNEIENGLCKVRN